MAYTPFYTTMTGFLVASLTHFGQCITNSTNHSLPFLPVLDTRFFWPCMKYPDDVLDIEYLELSRNTMLLLGIRF